MQLLLTMEPSIVERAATLLSRLVEDNPTLPRLYLTGAFFFALMYTGSNVLPIIQFLRVAHLNQLYRDEEADGHSTDTTDLVDILKGKSERLEDGALGNTPSGRLDGVKSLEKVRAS